MRIKRLGFAIWASKNFGGMERRFARLAEFLFGESDAIEVVIFAQRRCAAQISMALSSSENIKIIEFGSSDYRRGILQFLLELVDLATMLRRYKCDHLHLSMNPGIFSCIFAAIAPLDARMSICFVDPSYDTSTTRVSRFFANISLIRFHRIDCLSQQLFSEFKHFFWGLYRSRWQIAPCSFTDYSQCKICVERDIDVVFMARFDRDKGYDLLLGILKLLPELKIHFCGFGVNAPTYHCSNNVKIYKAENAFEVLGRAKIFLSIQKRNNYPSQATLEAMSSGCAIIATDVGETRKFLDESCALMISYNADELLMAIKTLIIDSELRAKLGFNARNIAIEKHTVQRYGLYFLEKIVEVDSTHHNGP
ncbi:glycosyltransferase [Polynucleobacter sp. JS-Mosq-20-D10]|uniref:glycosyltransferase n=1 Tax=Polynucleobacter sp. JS-Mosq-20-D10 TaxID=2576922 RepID=UPI001BFCF461|nr:glycosyltransferase [Polynucleobacter sp. JS-Mosq-20-D10]QWE00793.1 glycosyltransferase [Polynucleobacter sp. JS-Mosq-20-D10]